MEFCSVFFPNVKNGSLRSESGAKFENDSTAGAAASDSSGPASNDVALPLFPSAPVLHPPKRLLPVLHPP